jgi:hypothetical protein
MAEEYLKRKPLERILPRCQAMFIDEAVITEPGWGWNRNERAVIVSVIPSFKGLEVTPILADTRVRVLVTRPSTGPRNPILTSRSAVRQRCLAEEDPWQDLLFGKWGQATELDAGEMSERCV